ncbi:MAG: PASTA domain-containing protein [Prolixibacteraceae bacterium]|jgi:beta-lactam-binding protein with PASTA domain|nr:PASTA domain-containing protein [Prolixibacteraceae bacterium]
MSLKAFLKSKKFLFHLSLAVVVVVVLLYLTMLLIKVYTHHGKTMTVPDFIGLTESEVKIVVKENRLRYNIIDSVFVPDAIPGTIIAQHPEFGYHVKQRRNIYLTISAISPEKVILPFIVDVSLREAKSRLENAGLRLGQIKQRPSEFINLVLEKSLHGEPLPDDTLLIKGTAVDLVVGIGLSNEVTEIPNVLSLTIDEARDLLFAVELNTGAMIYDNSFVTAEDSLFARVWKQDPENSSSKLVGLGTSIDLWLTNDQEKIDLANEINY